jgi:uncharacterized phage-associated protein
MDDTDLKAFASANYILDKLEKFEINDVTNLKLQKLLYFAYGIYFILYDKKLFTSPIQAWKLGPVIPKVYHEFKNHGGKPITTRVFIANEDEEDSARLAEYSFTEEESKSLSIACAAYGHKKARTLVDITHNKNSAWSRAWNQNRRHILIPDEDIRNEFDGYLDNLAKYLLN